MSNLRDILKKRYHDRDKGSGTRARALNFPEDVKFWKPKASKRNTINILPYTIKTKNHPLVRSKDAEIGDEDFVLDIWIHQFVGPSGAEILCPKRNFGKPCPICEQADKLREEGKKDEASKLNPSHRVFYNIVDADDTNAGVQIFQASFKNFHKEMMDEAGAASDGDEAIDFVDFRNGKAVQFRATEESFGAGKKYFEFKSFKFVDREEPLDKALKKDILSLDEFLVVHSYEDIEKLFYGEDDDYGETKDEVAVEEEEEEEEEEDEEEEEEKPVAKPKKASVEDDEDDEDKEKPVAKPKKAPVEEDEEKPVAKQKKAPVEVEDNKCPYGLRFGIDCETDPKCDDCEVFSDCYKASKKLKK